MSKVNESIKGLYAKYLPDKQCVVYDGIVDEECFATQKCKVLFLLKDGNDPNKYEDGNGYTYRDLRNTAMATIKTDTPKTRLYRMWRVMCMWMQIVENTDFILEDCWNAEKGFDVDGMRGLLTHFATVNIKKTPGKESCPPKELREAVDAYYPLVKAEIELINPQLVICGGTFDFIKAQYPVKPEVLSDGSQYFVYRDCVYLECWHPAAFFGYEKHFAKFKKLYTAICERENCMFLNNK